MQKYEILDVIDEGAYGIVWKAVNRENQHLVAIKEFKEGDEDQFSRKTIQRQIRMLKMLKGDFVVNLREAFKKKGKIYLIFEYFQQNLLNLIEKYETGLQPSLINFIIYKIVKCIQHLHSKNIIHRDVKPQNILLNSDYSILKICDFGFARFLPEKDKDYDLTDYVATRWYRSPELLVGEPYGKPSDIWALGCMIGELVDSQPMFPGDDEIDQIHLINKLVGHLTPNQQNYFSRNPKFEGMTLPEVKRDETIQIRYLGKIQKNALSFMKACLKMNPLERITVEEALKHPYIIKYSIQDNEFTNDQQNLLDVHRKNQIKNQSKESKASIGTVQNEEERLDLDKKKILSNQMSQKIQIKRGLKLDGGSLNENDGIPSLSNSPELSLNTYAKKKSHAVFQTRLQDPPEKIKPKKLSKMMSEEKNLRLNLDVNLKINLKINQKSVQRRDIKEDLESKLQKKLNINGNNMGKNKLFPEIKNNSRATRYQLNIRHQKANQLISIVGERKEVIKNSKMTLNH